MWSRFARAVSCQGSLKLSKSILSLILTCIFNWRVNERTYAGYFKISQTTLTYASGNQIRCTNQWPISNLLQVNKKKCHTPEYGHTYKSFIYWQNVSMNTDSDLQLLLQLKLSVPCFKKWWCSLYSFYILWRIEGLW